MTKQPSLYPIHAYTIWYPGALKIDDFDITPKGFGVPARSILVERSHQRGQKNQKIYEF